MARANDQPILIKKVRKGHGHGHHGGGWKIAYADFATAMMAFFLLMWLLAATTEEQKLGIANFFMPTPFTKNDMVGSHGISGGQSLNDSGALDEAPRSHPDVAISMSVGEDGSADQDLSEEQLQEQVERADEAELQRVKAALDEAIRSDPELAGLGDNLRVDRTSEGVRIQMVDQERRSMFPLGRALLEPYTVALMTKLATIIGRTGRQISLTGHTDAIPFKIGSLEDNWQLSSDRANASRRALIAAGLPAARIARVVGKADTEPLDPAHPDAAQNRRISIVLLRQSLPQTARAPAAAAAE
jgi:chemotaxis protein MotB